MSSTNRGYDRHKSDYYVTPEKDVVEFLKHFQNTVLKTSDDVMGKINYLDPCCGGDDKNGATYIDVIKQLYNPKNIIGIDIRKDSKADVVVDYLNHTIKDSPDLIISNPPFYLAEEFINKSLEVVRDNGYVIMLLRLNFFGSKKRKVIFEQMMPEFCFVHHKRISFMNGKTDSIEYAHFVFRKGVYNDFCKTYVI